MAELRLPMQPTHFGAELLRRLGCSTNIPCKFFRREAYLCRLILRLGGNDRHNILGGDWPITDAFNMGFICFI